MASENGLFIDCAGEHILPDYIIIGAAKCGTTSLHRYICEHPRVKPALKKELQFFDFEYQNGLDWYRSHFPVHEVSSLPRQWLTGEATPYYLKSARAASRIHEVGAATGWRPKFIVILRDPVVRAYSHYQMAKNQYEVESSTFEEAIANEHERTVGLNKSEGVDGIADVLLSYVGSSLYADQLQQWFGFFGRNRFLFLQTERLRSEPSHVLDKTFRFLGLPPLPAGREIFDNKAHYRSMGAPSADKLSSIFQEPNRRLFEMIGEEFDWPSHQRAAASSRGSRDGISEE